MADSDFNPADKSPNVTLSEENAVASVSITQWFGVRTSVISGKWYAEFSQLSGSNTLVGAALLSAALNHPYSITGAGVNGLRSNGQVHINGVSYATRFTYSSGDRVGVAVDTEARKIWFSLNGAWDGDPETGSGGFVFPGVGDVCFYATNYASSVRIYTTASAISSPAPNGFLPIPPGLLQGNATIDGSDPVEFVTAFEWPAGGLTFSAEPDLSGDWSMIVNSTKQYGVVYIADGCQPIVHGPYMPEVA